MNSSWFWIILFCGCVWSDKLDRRYLPPPGASLAGGSPGDILAPLELPNLEQRGLTGLEEYKPIGQTTVVPITTTSYAFTQTTTFPPIESYESTGLSLDPVTGLPLQNIGKLNYQGQTYPGYTQEEGNIKPVPDNQYINTGNTNFPEFGNQLEHSPGGANLQQNFEDQFSLDEQSFPHSTPSLQEIESSRLPSGQYQIGSKTTSFGQPINVKNNPIYATKNNQPNNFTYAPFDQIYRQERPQAEADRNAVILNYENVRTPTGYSYSFDTSNGIHADENGLVKDGTRVQGSYSYIGDDGKVYNVTYTADENGFQPRGDHLPTPPPVPEEIQRIIEKVAREKEYGIVDDGSYNEEKYGYKNYQQPIGFRRQQIQKIGNADNPLLNVEQSDRKPVIGLTEYDYEDETSNKFSNSEENRNKGNRRPTTQTPLESLNKITYEDNSKNIPRVTTKFSEYDENSTPTNEVSFDNAEDDNQQKYTKTQIPGSRPENLEYSQNNDFYKEGEQVIKDVIPESYKPEQFPLQNDNGIQRITIKNQESNQNGYQYIPPEIQFQRTQFPTRFKEAPSTTTEVMQNKTRRPFMTPEIYNQASRLKENNSSPFNTKKPLVTSQATPKVNYNYNNDDDDEDYNSPDSNGNDINTTIDSNGINYNGQPFEPTRTGINTQRTPFNQENRRGTVTPGDVDGIVSSTSGPVTSTFVSMETNKPNQLRYQYKANYRNSTNNGIQPVYGSSLQYEQSTPVSQNYQSSTYNPYSSTELPVNIPEYQSNSRISPPSDSYQPIDIYNKKYQYGPDQFVPGYSRTVNEQKPTFISDKTSIPNLSNQYINTPTLAPLGYPMNPTYTTNNGSPIPTIQSKLASRTNYENNFPQEPALGYIYGPPQSTTSSTYTIGTSPGYVISSTTPGRTFQDYSTTEYPFSSDRSIYDQTLVDGFGRPISFDQQPRYPYFGQNLVKSGQEAGSDNKNEGFPSNELPTSGSILVIGEDFSGPKQIQKFDPQTGYHYK